MVHALAHATGGIAHVPHGVANAIFLPHGIRYNVDKAQGELTRLADILGIDGGRLNERQRALEVADWVSDLNARLNRICGLPVRLRDAGVSKNQLETIAKAAINDGAVTYNPEELTYEEALEVLHQAF